MNIQPDNTNPAPTTLPTRPGDVPHTATLAELVTAYHHHTGPLVDAHHKIGKPLPAGQLAAHAVAALAVQHELSARVLASRWCNARDALAFGASIADVAAGMGLDEDEIRAGLGSWADGQLRHGLLSAAAYDEVLALLGGVTQ